MDGDALKDHIFAGHAVAACAPYSYPPLSLTPSTLSRPSSRSIGEVGPVSPLAASLAAGFSGTVACAASHSFDTAKSRTQCIVTPKYIAMERKLLRWEAPGNWIERVTGMSPADRNIMFRGFSMRMARSGIASFAVVGGYLFAVDHLF